MDIVNESFSKTMLHILKHPKQQIIKLNVFLKNITIQWLGQFSWIVGFYLYNVMLSICHNPEASSAN